MKEKLKVRENSLKATVVMIVSVAVLFAAAFFKIEAIMEERCLERMEEGVDTVIKEITAKLDMDSRILNAAANILSRSESFERDSLWRTMDTFSPLIETMKIRILLPDNTVIESDGTTADGTGYISFEEEADKGEHVSSRMTSVIDGNTQILRHFVPIRKNGETAALLYGVTRLADLPLIMNVENFFGGRAEAYILDTKNGDFIMDTRRDSLGNIHTHPACRMKDGENWDSMVQNMTEGGKDLVVYLPDEKDEWTYLYYGSAEINNWAIGVTVPEKVALAGLYAIRRVWCVIAILMTAAIALYYLYMWRDARTAVSKAVERAVLEEKLKKAKAAERAKTMFLSNMSHDIRTPMNAIIGFATLAETNIDNKERVKSYLERILSSGSHLLSLINDVLDMSRIESGRLNIEEKECSISDVFRDMRNIILTQMRAKQLNFSMNTIDVTDEDIYCDKLHLNQVLLNLLSNAIKFTPSDGAVSLTLRQMDDAPEGCGSYEIRVKDTGIGMAPEFAEHIFEPFERERTSTVSGIQGTGLGMAITKSIVDAMGGTIQVETEKGKGTEFIVRFTFRLQHRSEAHWEIRELEGLRALVVDSSFDTCDSVTRMLKKIGMRAEWTLHGKEAVLRARQSRELEDEFCAYIIDWMLPDLNGLEVVRQIRSSVGKDAPIVVLTAYDVDAMKDEAREAGVTTFCHKPIFLSEMREILAEVVGKSVSAKIKTLEQNNSGEPCGHRLLLVEDNELNREIAEELLAESGFIVESVEDGILAVDTMKNVEPGYYDLILMDIQMPIMNGYDAARAIRNLNTPGVSDIPIVAMTANAFDEDRRKAFESGMDAHVAKPIDVDRLLEVLHSLLAA